MPLDVSLVGTAAEPRTNEIDARWTMAYAAALGDLHECYIDTRRAGDIAVHPLFPVCVEWPSALDLRSRYRHMLAPAEAARGVHATHHTIIHRALRPPERVTTRAVIEGIEARKPGAYEVTRFDTADAAGAPVCTTYYGTIYREVAITGTARPAATPEVPTLKATPARARTEMRAIVTAGAAHVYTECARIWNPIHTDAKVAAAAGLPAIMLHGTATLALAVSRIIAAEAGNDPERVAEIYARFGAMVFMPSEMIVRIIAREPHRGGGAAIFFEALSAEGGRAVRDGAIILRP
ncbi:MAG: MaoC family dehydratase N-terminal domain-containing protein [Candidatus Binataceae bacterium]|nr:MaoC family dehydratase N-terminal domain-containing protein [Candidatus Binataceae bacterium]